MLFIDSKKLEEYYLTIIVIGADVTNRKFIRNMIKDMCVFCSTDLRAVSLFQIFTNF